MSQLDVLSRTALVPFWARVQDAQSVSPVLGDRGALSLAGQVRERFGEVPVDRSTEVGCCLRNRIVDEWIMRLAGGSATSAAVVDIGVGLDTRLRRHPGITADYIEVDSAPVIGLREEWMPDTGAVRVIGDGMWPSNWIPYLGRDAREVTVVVMEGVLVYQDPDRVAGFFTQLSESLPGAYLVFDSLSPCSAWLANRSACGAGRPRYEWAPWRVGRLHTGGPRLRVLEVKGFMDLPRHLRRALPRTDRLFHSLPPMRRSYRLTLAQLPK